MVNHCNTNIIIGVDFDNTIICYDEILHQLAVDQRYIKKKVKKIKKNIRDAVRSLSDGEQKWRHLQASIYGPMIGGAFLFQGVTGFLAKCRKKGIPVFIVSHKTEFADSDTSGSYNLRNCASTWIQQHLVSDNTGLDKQNIYFESSRFNKIERIKSLNCTHFIDDLEELFHDPLFPLNTEKIFFNPHPNDQIKSKLRVFSTWKEINDYFHQ